MKGGIKMGYFKQLEIELQDIHDPHMREVVLWKRLHQHKMTAQELWDVMVDEQKMQQALTLWRNEQDVPAPVKAKDHVSSHVSRRDLRVKKSRMPLLGWALIIVALVSGLTVLVVSL
jgi:hypothetical protein